MSELDSLDPVPETLKLSTGTVVVLEDLRARQFFRFLRIITHGALPVMQDMSIFKLDPDADAAEFGTRLLSLMVLSIPDAEEETIDFVRAMCKPSGLIEGRKLNKQDTERNAELWSQVDTDLQNPELDDLVSIIEAVIRRESADIQALGKRLAAMFKLAQRTGQLPSSPNPTSSTTTSSAGSLAPSTYSVTSTDGPTTPSQTYASVGSVSAPPPSENDASTPGGSETSG